MHVEAYMRKSKGAWPRKGSKAIESEWLRWFDYHPIVSRSIWIGDPHQLHSTEGLLIKVPNGPFYIEVKAMDFGGHRRFSRLRFTDGKVAPMVAAKIGAV